MYTYTDFDKQFVRLRAQQFRDQLERWQRKELSDEQLLPLRLQNGWYLQRHAPMLRVAVPYGEISSARLRVLARVARHYDVPKRSVMERAQLQQNRLQASQPGLTLKAPALKCGFGHFTTRTNVQFNWIALEDAADVMDLLASAGMHGIQTSGNVIRNITCDVMAGIAPQEVADVRPFAEILRQWSTMHPEFSFLPRKFKIALNGGIDDRAATAWYDIGLQARRNEQGLLGFAVKVGGGMGRTPMVGALLRPFLPWWDLLNYLEAVVRIYNLYGRRDNKYKARIKMVVKSEGEKFTEQVEAEFKAITEQDGAAHIITQEELDRVRACFVVPPLAPSTARVSANFVSDKSYLRWLKHNVHQHAMAHMAAVTLSFKRPGWAPGDADERTLDELADLADVFSAGEARLTHEQNLLLPWVHATDLPALYEQANALGLAQPNIGLITDMISCPGGDYCALANARAIPIASALSERFQSLDDITDLGPIDLHLSGCVNSCGHHHSGHIGILGVDKDGQEWYQVTLGGSDGSPLSGPATPGKVVGAAFSAAEIPGVVSAVVGLYRRQRASASEPFIKTLTRVGHESFAAAANAARSVPKDEPRDTLKDEPFDAHQSARLGIAEKNKREEKARLT